MRILSVYELYPSPGGDDQRFPPVPFKHCAHEPIRTALPRIPHLHRSEGWLRQDIRCGQASRLPHVSLSRMRGAT
jgi:hypothetical protein